MVQGESHSLPTAVAGGDGENEGSKEPLESASRAPASTGRSAGAFSTASPSKPAVHELTAFEQGIFSIESRRWRFPGAKEQAIAQELRVSPHRYYQILNALIDEERAIARYPLLTARLRAHRDTE